MNRFIFEKPIGKLDLGNPERPVFTNRENVVMKWNARETRVEWQVDIDRRIKTGVIDLKDH